MTFCSYRPFLQGKESEKHDHKETAHPDFTAGVVADSGDGHPDLIRNEYDARFTDMPDGFEMQYDEPDAHVKITCREGMAIMERSGVPESRMEFVPGQTIAAAYILPEGAFDMSVECTSLSLERVGSRGVLRIAYRLLSAGQLMSDNRLMITYRVC